MKLCVAKTLSMLRLCEAEAVSSLQLALGPGPQPAGQHAVTWASGAGVDIWSDGINTTILTLQSELSDMAGAGCCSVCGCRVPAMWVGAAAAGAAVRQCGPPRHAALQNPAATANSCPAPPQQRPPGTRRSTASCRRPPAPGPW